VAAPIHRFLPWPFQNAHNPCVQNIIRDGSLVIVGRWQQQCIRTKQEVVDPSLIFQLLKNNNANDNNNDKSNNNNVVIRTIGKRLFPADEQQIS
jgi:hypothetical protein